jgi:ABC-2 type transport system ATP-binding protein
MRRADKPAPAIVPAVVFPANAAAVEVAHLTKTFEAVHAVEDVSFTIQRGSTTALLGANGAGKTTTVALILGLLLPTSGSIHVLGQDMLRHRYRVLPRLNLSSPYVDLPRRLSAYQNLSVYARLYGLSDVKERIARMAERVELSDFLHRPVGSLSAGQRSRVALAKALINDPDLLLLDEPTASMDPDTADRMRGWLERYRSETGATILLASHNMAEVERLCDDVLMLKAGRLVDRGAPSALIARYGRANLEEVFLDIARAPHGAAAQ